MGDKIKGFGCKADVMVEVQEHVEEPEALKTPSDPAEAYEVIVKAVVEQMSGDAETATQLKASLEAMYNNPPHKTVSGVLPEPVGVDTMRRLLFCPTPADMATYSQLIRGAAEMHNEIGEQQPAAGKAATPFLSLLYLHHSHVSEAAR